MENFIYQELDAEFSQLPKEKIAKIMLLHGIHTEILEEKIIAYSYCYDKNGTEFLEKTDVTNFTLQEIMDYLGY